MCIFLKLYLLNILSVILKETAQSSASYKLQLKEVLYLMIFIIAHQFFTAF